jgi:hypothetical protein
MRFLRSKRFWKRLAIGFCLVAAVLLIVNGVLAWRAEHRLQQRISLIRAEGAPAAISDLAPEPIPDEENAAAILKRITPRINAFAHDEGTFSTTPVGLAYDERDDLGEPPTPEQMAAIRAIVDKYPELDGDLAAAAACDRYGSLVDFSLDQDQFIEAVIELQGPIRQAVRFLNYKNIVDLADGRQQQAVDRGMGMLRLARLYDNEPTLVSFLVGVAVRRYAIASLYDALAAGPISAEMHAALDAELARHDGSRRLVNALKSERAIGAGWFDALGKGRLFFAHSFAWPMKGYQIGVLDAMNEHIRVAETPWHEIRAQFGTADSPAPPSGHGVMADLLVPAVRASFHANARGLAMLRSLRIYNSLRQFKVKNGREATGLADLNLPAAATMDPYSGQPLKLKRTDDGWMVYSVMVNGLDDGGDFVEHKDYGVAPPRYRVTEKPTKTVADGN